MGAYSSLVESKSYAKKQMERKLITQKPHKLPFRYGGSGKVYLDGELIGEAVSLSFEAVGSD